MTALVRRKKEEHGWTEQPGQGVVDCAQVLGPEVFEESATSESPVHIPKILEETVHESTRIHAAGARVPVGQKGKI